MQFSADERTTNIVVELEGSYRGPSRFVLPKDVTLLELLDNIPVDANLADTQSISLRRKACASVSRNRWKRACAGWKPPISAPLPPPQKKPAFACAKPS